MSVTSAVSRVPVALVLIVLNAWMLWRQLRRRNYRRASGLVVVIAMLAGWVWLPPSILKTFSAYLHQLGLETHSPKVWKEINYDRVVGTVGTVGTLIQFLFYRSEKKEPRPDYDSDDDENRRGMIEAVRTRVDKLLEKTINKGGEMDLGFVEVPDALIRLEELSRGPYDAPTVVPAGMPVLSVFDKFGRHLLILGAPGAGKTTLLRKLARALVERAEKDGHERIPVIFELSTWASVKNSPLTDWMVERLWQSYHVPREVGEDWVKRKPDPAAARRPRRSAASLSRRDACVDAINQFRREHGFVPVAVCCRVKDYDSIGQKLELDGAVAVRPLARADVEDYLQRLGQPLEGVRQVLVRDAAVWELLDTPLIVDILIRSYQGLPAESLALPGGIDERRRHLFKAYVDRMFQHRPGSPYPRGRVEYWLTWLAQQLSRHGKDFYLQDLQVEWLPQKTRWYQSWAVRLAFGLVGGLFGWLVLGLVGGLNLGGGVFIRHFILRAQLAFEGFAPFRYLRFLEYATTLLFLERDGGAYRFRHDLLQEYFAALT
jgi:energy-coupling factor transporter ATP-binding protein EcfA2